MWRCDGSSDKSNGVSSPTQVASSICMRISPVLDLANAAFTKEGQHREGAGPRYLRLAALGLGSRLTRPGEFLALLCTGRTKDEPVHDVGDGVRGFTRLAVGKAVIADVRIDDELIPLANVRGQRGRRLAKGGEEEAGNDFLLV